MIRSMDFWLIDNIFHPLTVWFYKLTGISNYTVAKLILMVSTGILVVGAMVALIPGLLPGHPILVTALLMLLYFKRCWPVLNLCIKLEREWAENPAHLAPNLRDPMPDTVEYEIADMRKGGLSLVLAIPFVWLAVKLLVMGAVLYFQYFPEAVPAPTAPHEHHHERYTYALVLLYMYYTVVMVATYVMSCLPPPAHRQANLVLVPTT